MTVHADKNSGSVWTVPLLCNIFQANKNFLSYSQDAHRCVRRSITAEQF